MDVNVPLKRLMNADNVLDKIEELDNRTSPENSEYVDSADEISLRTGEDMVVDSLLVPAEGVEVLDPTDSTFTGHFISNSGYQYDSIIAQIGGVLFGHLQWGANTSGQMVAAAGNLVIDYHGIFLNDSYILAQLSSPSNSNDTDDIYFGGFYVYGIGLGHDGKMIFGNLVLMRTGDNLLDNGDFSVGDFTGWTQTGSPSIVEDSPNNIYSAGVGSTDFITQNVTTVTGSDYLFKFFVRRSGGTGSDIPAVRIGGLSANEFFLLGFDDDGDTNWIEVVCLFRAIGTTTEIKVYSTAGEIRFTNLDFRELDSWSYLGDVDTDHVGNLKIASQRNITIEATPSTTSPQTSVYIRNPIKLPEVTTPSSDGSAAGNMNTNWPASGYDNLYFKSDHKLYVQDTNGNENGFYFSDEQREVLSAARTYYVRTDGNNSNDGLSNTAGGAFLTIQKAVDTIATLDINGKTVTVQVADGTYTGTVVLKNVVGYSIPGNLVIQGNNSTPANVLINTTGVCFTASKIQSVWDIKDLKVVATTQGLKVDEASLRFGNLDFGACTAYHMWANVNAHILALSNYSISGNAAAHYEAGALSIIELAAITVTITANITLTTFADAVTISLISAFSVTYSLGAFTVTAKRYSAVNNSVINTFGGGANYFPGNVAGTTATGGQYL